jgi:hypothetical protein
MAQYQLQLIPGLGYTGSVSFTCGGAPLGATCQVPPSVPVANGAPSPFTVTVSTSGGAVLPPSLPVRLKPFGGFPWLPSLVLATVMMMIIATRRRAFENAAYPRRLALSGALVALASCAALTMEGCGGGSAAVLAPPPIVTPTGTSTIVLTPTAMSASGQPLQLQPIQLTLTVK